MDVIYLFKALLRRRWTILFCLGIGLLAGLIIRISVPREYLSTAQYSTGFAQTQKVSLQLTEIYDLNQIDARINNVIETFKSPIVLSMVSYDLLLHDLDSDRPFRNLTDKQKEDTAFKKADIPKARLILRDRLSNLSLLSTYDPQDKMVWNILNLYDYGQEDLLKKLAVERVTNTDYINVSFSSENPELSAYVSNKIGVKFKEFFSSLSSTNTKESLYKLDSLRETKSREVDTLRNRLQRFRDKIGTPNPGDAATAAMSGLQELTSSLTAQQANLNDYRQRLISVNDQLHELETNPSAATGGLNNNHGDEILALRRTNEELASKLALKGGLDQNIQKQIDDNINKINQMSRGTGNQTINPALKAEERKELLLKDKLELQSAIASTTDNIEMYKSRVEQFRKIAFSGGGQEVIANAYLNDLMIAQKDLEKYNSSIFASQDIDVSPDFKFKQIMLGQPPIKPEPGKGLIVILVSGFSLFFLSILIIIILELLDTSLRTPSIFRKETKLDVLSTVGQIDLEKKTLKEYFDFSLRSERGNNELPFIENLRKMRYEIEHSGKRVILFTSTKTQEGKTTMVESLAYTFSRSKKKVLIIDANFNNNNLTRDFSAKPTLISFSLRGQEGLEKIWNITTVTNITDVDVIGCEEGNYTPSEILPKNNLLDHFDKLKQHYDYILLEGAALNTHADSKELTDFVEGVVLVFSAKNSLGEIDRESIAFLKIHGSKFIGAVLNNVDEQNLDL
ncbi:MAG TPA: AAA family ATPase [Puia sp.]|nr:AAA family ATPase [Puia sp.]